MSKHYRCNKNIYDYTFEKYLEEHGGLDKMKKTLKDIESYKELTECLNKGKLSSWNYMKEEVNNFIQKWKECNTNHVN
jgi:coenzyme F420-reducing hydrogenase beta subunit